MNDRLEKYKEMRDFEKTSEPSGGLPTEQANSFVIQKHAATALHYDVRFEVEDVMPSWAVPKGPSYDPKVKRLAMHTEDHPLDYQTFEGVIPKGEYGGGRVIVWDNGTYDNITEKHGRAIPMRQAIDSGHFSVFVHGNKLRGGWSFTRTSRAGNKESWIMIKRNDEHADNAIDITKERPESVTSGHTIESIGKDPRAKQWTRSVATFVPPMLATLTKSSPTSDDWTYERKLDGLRCIAVRNGDVVQLWSRNHLSFDARFPHIVDALLELRVDDFVIDGEIVAFDRAGHTSFSLLQSGPQDASPQLHVFDVVHLLGQNTTKLGLAQRQQLLRQLGVDGRVVQIVESLDGSNADELLARACQEGWEGLIAKRDGSPYSGGRSPHWLKLKCSASQELVIGGWTEPRGARTGFGALLVGYYEDAEFRYAGKVGTGFSHELLTTLYDKLARLERKTSPFADTVKEKTAHWCTPSLVANIGFSEWTSDGKLRHPRFEGLRTDTAAKGVTRERR